jgi:hypothetical protein
MNTMTELLLTDIPTNRMTERQAEAAAGRLAQQARAADTRPARTWSLAGFLHLPSLGRRLAREL